MGEHYLDAVGVGGSKPPVPIKDYRNIGRKVNVMPKMKSNSGAKKRFRKTGTGKIKFKRAYHSHILTTKTTKKKRNQRRMRILPAAEQKRVKRLLPYL